MATYLAPLLPELEGVGETTFGEVCGAMLAFAALAFGASIAGAVAALALPPDRLLATMVLNDAEDPKYIVELDEGVLVPIAMATDASAGPTIDGAERRSLYADLMFVFVYSANVQVALAFASLLMFLLIGGSPLAPDRRSVGQLAALAVLVTAAVYSFLQMAAVIRALSSVARRRDSFFRGELLSSHARAMPVQGRT
ncbi:MAG: hypothetical protein HGA44_14740 [Cellulomonadaceae bacterium]|nr:hypothetical protein [Cellulomonadaceae bacterium]